ncbi:MAG: hypothetical protein EXS15_07515 [Phycisphaerales bacterium]|nr:hypothetical protein [Phycisphaerales bacterium]
MTNQTNQTNQTNTDALTRRTPTRFLMIALVTTACCATLLSCAEEEEAAPVVRYAPPPPPPPEPEPTVQSIEELMKEHNIDVRVQLPEGYAPETTEKRVAVLKFWNAFAKGDSAYAGSHMSDLDRKVMEGLAKDGSWSATTAKITTIEVQCKDESDGFATFAVVTTDGTEQPMLFDAEMVDADAVFTAFPGPPDIMEHLSGEDSISSWKTYVDGLFEKYSNLPDEIVEIPQSDLQTTEGDQTADAGGGGGGDSPPPGGGSGGGVLRKKPHAPLPD